MAWTAPYRPEHEPDKGIYWQETDTDDMFSQFLDFDPDAPSATAAAMALGSSSSPGMPPMLAAPSSIGSTSDELDFLSTSSQAAPLSHQDEVALFGGSSSHAFLEGSAIGSSESNEFQHGDSFGGIEIEGHFDFGLPRGSMSDTDLSRLEGISLNSPTKKMAVSDPSSPTPPSTVVAGKKQPNRFVEALSSTIRKATNMRGRTTKRGNGNGDERAASPGVEGPDQSLRMKKTRKPASINTAAAMQIKQEGANHYPSPPIQTPLHPQQQQQQQQHAAGMSFVNGYCEDPFTDAAPPPALPPQPRYFSAATTPMDSPVEMFHPGGHTDPLPQGHGTAWPEQQWNANGTPATAQQHPGWWDMNLVNQSQEQMLIRQRHASFSSGPTHHQQHQQQQQQQQLPHHPDVPFEYAHAQAHAHNGLRSSASGGLMIQMPQGHPAQHQQPHVMTPGGTSTGELALTAQTYLPPPIPASEQRPSRPPRAKSSGARHLSISPMRKTRAPSASPTRRNSRHSSGGSVSSIRSASGTMPGTPCSVKKRRSRDVSGGGGMVGGLVGSSSMGGLGGGSGGGGGGGGGFVNFTPSDGGVLMTGVAPSGSSKTKARREKEAMERRRRMSEAAMKAVAAAGGDVEKLIEQGFAF